MSLFRKVAQTAWKDAGDPSVYGLLEIDVKDLQSQLKNHNESRKTKLQFHHLVAQAAAKAMLKVPEINAYRSGRRIYRREDVDVGFLLHIPQPRKGADKALGREVDLSVCKLETVDRKSLVDIESELTKKASEVRSDPHLGLGWAAPVIRNAPQFLVDLLFWLFGKLNFDFRWNLKPIGLPKDPYGACLITSLASFGCDHAFVPLVPLAKAPLYIAVNQIKSRPAVVSDPSGEERLAIRPILPLGFTFDHRFVDGYHAGVFIKEFKRCLASPDWG